MTDESIADAEMTVESHCYVPQGSVVTAVITCCTYLDPEGGHGFAVRAHGDMPSTTYLGLLVRAQAEVLEWE